MKYYTCPHCLRKTINKSCDYCKMDIDDSNELSSLLRKLKVSVRIKNNNDVLKYAKEILEIDNNYFYALYHKAFIYYLDGLEEELFDLLKGIVNCKEIDEIINHMIIYINDKEKVRCFITMNGGVNQEHYLQCLNNNVDINNDVVDKLFSNTILRFKTRKSQRNKNGKIYIISGVVVWIIFSLIMLLFTKEIRYLYTILLLILPSYLIAQGLMHVSFKISKTIYTVLFFILTLILISYISLIDIQNGFFDHAFKVITYPYQFIKFYVEDVI